MLSERAAEVLAAEERLWTALAGRGQGFLKRAK